MSDREHKNKKRILSIDEIAKNGINKNYTIPFVRNKNEVINFKETVIGEIEDKDLFYLKPIFDVWHNQK